MTSASSSSASPHGSRDSCAISSVIAQQEGLAQAQIIDALRQIPLFNQINGAGIPAGDHGEPDVEALLQLSRKPHSRERFSFFGMMAP